MNLHIKQLAGENTHHVVEAMFKAVAKIDGYGFKSRWQNWRSPFNKGRSLNDRGGRDVSYKKLIPFINGENELAANVVTMAEDYCFAGADELFLYNYSKNNRRKRRIFSNLKRDW